jgi:hypothetical protein
MMMVEQAQQAEKRSAARQAVGVYHGASPLVSGKADNLKRYLKELD